MTRRAVALGLALGMLVSVATYFNDWIIGQTLFIGNYLPISVFGTVVVLALGTQSAALSHHGASAFHRG